MMTTTRIALVQQLLMTMHLLLNQHPRAICRYAENALDTRRVLLSLFLYIFGEFLFTNYL
jgi:hypothetical protein